jgi:glucan phosphorylase
MKFALNGALTIGTLDGANVEIREHVGADNFFLFGMTAPEVVARRRAEHAKKAIEASPHLAEAIADIESGAFSPGDPDRYADVADNLRWSDYFLVCSDFAAYYDKQREVDRRLQGSRNLDAHGGVQHGAHRLVLVRPHHSRLHERRLGGAFGHLNGGRAIGCFALLLFRVRLDS